MKKSTVAPRRAFKALEHMVFSRINALLSRVVERTGFSKRLFDCFGRILPIPQAIIRGVPIKIILPLNQVGVYNTFKNWEEREPEVLDWIDSFEKGCTFFDVGASFGTETLYAALKNNGPQKIVAFDLALQSSFNLAYNISLNNISHVDQYYLALSDKMAFYTFYEPTQYYFIKDRDKYDFLKYHTLSISLDQFIQIVQIFPDYIKIDVDGAELNLIAGMRETVRNERLRAVCIEVSGQSEPATIDFFEKAGFFLAWERRFTEEAADFKNLLFTRK